MSYVTNVVMTINGFRRGGGNADVLNAWLWEQWDERYEGLTPEERGQPQQLRQINMDGTGGSKRMEVDVWAAALNSAPMGMKEFLDTLDWGEDDCCIVVGEDGGKTWGEPWGTWGDGWYG